MECAFNDKYIKCTHYTRGGGVHCDSKIERKS